MVDFVVKKSFFVGASTGDITQDYELGKKLGDGAYGVVYLGTHKASGAERAIKQIPKSRIRNPERLETEITVMKESDHPNIVRLYEVYEDSRNVFLVMEKCSGGELFDFVLSKKRLSEKEAAALFKQMVAGVRYLHTQNIVHRDLKPENLIFLNDPNEETLLKLCDFGLSKMMMSPDETTMQTRAGTPFYIAPEVISGQNYGNSCDVWSCGVILYILISGYPPFFGRNDNIIYQKVREGNYNFNRPEWNNVTGEVKDLITRILVVDPNDRISLEEVMNHPWLTNQESLPESPLDLDINSLMEYTNSSKLKRVMLMCIASQCSDSEISNLREVFTKLDTNGDGTLSLDELKQGFSELAAVDLEIESLMKAMDFDKNNRINYTEFVAASLEANLHMLEQKIYSAFRMFDRDGSGKITAGELREVLGREAPHSQEFWEGLIQECDTNADGEIDFHEFLNMMVGRKKSQIA